MHKITFCIPSKSNLQYLKKCIPSIRKNAYRNDHDILIFVDSDDDGTIDWLNEIQNIYNIKYYVNPNLNEELYGIGKAYDFLIKHSSTEVFMIFHADMILGKHADLYLSNNLEKKSVTCSTRIEPPLHPNNGEKIQMELGIWPDDFNESKFDHYTELNKTNSKITDGIFAPWMMYKSEYIDYIGGHDSILHSCREDSDIFNRMLLSDFKFKQIWNSFVYHFTGRGAGSFSKDVDRHEKWKHDMHNSTIEFIRKWKTSVKHTPLMKPIVSNRYDIGFVIHNCTPQHLGMLEPFTDTIYTDLDYSNYLYTEQPNTKFDLSKKLKSISDIKSNDIIIEFDALKLTNNSFQLFNILPDMLQDSGRVGSMTYDIFKFTINKLHDYKNNLIHINNDWYKNKLL
jgi:glycosyltransferase involved in cell wall biosynthesis